MTRHAKASSAGSNSGLRAKTPALLGLIALLTLVVGVSVAIAAKKVDSFAGSPTGATGNTAGLLNNPRGIAVNQNGTGGAVAGDFYVVDGSNNRIVQYRANNTFVRAFGQDVVSSGPDQAIEVQRVTVNANEGTFKLTFGANTTSDLPFNATAGEVQTALNALASVNSGGGSVTVSGGPGNAGGSTPYVVSFSGAPLKGTNVAQMTGASGATPLGGGTGTGANTATVLTANSGANGYEICDVLVNPTDVCKAGTTGGLGGALSAAQGVAIEQSTGNLFVTDQSNRRVQKFSAVGAWLLAFGSDVVQTGGSGDNPFIPSLNEKQTVRLQALFGINPPPATGNFTLTFESQTTAQIPAQATPAAVDAALEALSTVGPGGVSVSGPNGPNWSVEFTGPLAGINVSPLTGNPLTGNPAGLGGEFPEVVVETTQPGGPSAPVLSEVCSLMWQCKAAGPAAVEAGAFSTFIGYPAVDSSGNVYVPDSSNSRVQKFSSSGTFLTAWGWDVIPAGRPGDTGTGLESCPAAAASTIGNCQAGTAGEGEGLGQFGSDRPSRIAVDSTGRVFALSNGRGVQTFDSSGGSPAKFAPADIPASPTATNIAIGAGDRVFVTQTCSAALCPDAAVATEQRIKEFSSAGVLQDTHMVGAGFTTVNGLAVNSTSGNLLVSTSGGTPGSRVWTLDDNGAQPASVAVISPPTEVTEHTASLNGSLTPNGPAGFTTSYRFEYSRNGVTWTPVAAEVNLGEGLSPVSVPTAPAQGAVTGLEANTFYRARIVAKKAFGAGTTISPEVTFLTDGVRPEVATYHPQSHTDTTANLLGQLNPNNLPTTYHFEYGKTTAYGNSAPVPDAGANGGVANLVSQQVEGLEPGTTYHYRLVASNSEGTKNGNDVTFKTYPADSVGLAQRAYEMMTPPFKTVRSPVAFGGTVGNSPNPGVPSLSGDAMLWATAIFPLTEDVKAPGGGDVRYLERGAGGWSFTTQNTLTMKSHVAGEVQPASVAFARFYPAASTGDLKTNSVVMVNGELIASDGFDANQYYTYRAGTGVEGGYTPWLTNTDTQLKSGKLGGAWGPPEDTALLNDDGTALLRWGSYRGLAEDPSTLGDDDPSDEQLRALVPNEPPARSIYLQRAADPNALPVASRDLVSECTGSGAGATEIPNRVGTGSASTDTIGTQPCVQASTPAATGTAVRSTGSATLTGVTTGTGAFSVGQIVSGTGIPYGATISAVGAGTLTLSSPVLCGGAKGNEARITAGSPEVTWVRTLCGKFEVGQTVTGAGIPVGTTIVAIDKFTFTLSAAATASGIFQEIAADAPTTTAIVASPQHVTSRGGARAGGFASIGALSDDGNRVFFMSPDFSEEGSGGSGPAPGCAPGTGTSTSCSPQLFVRQYDSAGNPTVRWISRAQGVGAQRVDEMGRGALFQGASRDGRYVYFQTEAPLLPNDPNAGVSITTGSAQANSWDLYRYTLPASRDVDPTGGTLLRVSGGPTGTADPDVTTVPKTASLRYFSDDGKRAYFLTTATIPGALNTPPGGGSTAPSGAVGNNATRNLYLFDDTGVSPQWRFIAQLPYSISISKESKEALNTCATSRALIGGGHIDTSGSGGFNRSQGQNNCFRGTRDGSGVIFFTRGQLTTDDRDDAGDIYLYDAEADELTRVSAPRYNTTPYICNGNASTLDSGVCNADMGMNLSGGGGFAAAAGTFDFARGWGGGRLYNVAKDANGKISVYFESQSQLIPQDTNGTRMDVYEWRAGKLSLVSPGNTDSHSFYSGNSVDGRDIFLFTSARIDPREIDDDDFDLYDARRGGGFPYTPPATPCEVLAHQCRQAVPAPPAAPAPASQGLNGQGNQPKQPKQSCAKGKKLRQGKCVVKKSKAHKKHRKGATQRGSK